MTTKESGAASVGGEPERSHLASDVGGGAERLCVFCEHLEYNSAGYGEYADPAELECRRGHRLHQRPWPYDRQNVYSIEDFRQMILTAQNCKDYERPLPEPPK